MNQPNQQNKGIPSPRPIDTMLAASGRKSRRVKQNSSLEGLYAPDKHSPIMIDVNIQKLQQTARKVASEPLEQDKNVTLVRKLRRIKRRLLLELALESAEQLAMSPAGIQTPPTAPKLDVPTRSMTPKNLFSSKASAPMVAAHGRKDLVLATCAVSGRAQAA